jgi:hypothetical protein
MTVETGVGRCFNVSADLDCGDATQAPADVLAYTKNQTAEEVFTTVPGSQGMSALSAGPDREG